METLVQLIFIIALLKYCLKAALSGGFRSILLYALGLSVWALLWYPLVIHQPVTLIETLLLDEKVVADGAVLTTIEAVAGILISIKLLDNYFAPKPKRKRLLFILKIVPGVLALTATLYFELLFFKMRVLGDFLVTALLYAGLCTSVILGLSLLLKHTVSGESLKLEMKLLLNMAILCVGLLINASVADYNLSAAQTEIEWLPLLTLIGLTLRLIL